MTALPDYLERATDDPFDGDQARELLERVAQITALTEHPGWAFLHDYIVAQTTAEQRYVLLGRCSDQIDYATRTAKVAGMLAVLDAPQKLRDQFENRPEQEVEG